jgi:hypothetical protein
MVFRSSAPPRERFSASIETTNQFHNLGIFHDVIEQSSHWTLPVGPLRNASPEG